jgi:BirA family biotin operon repressor/biotin-[acetyl-CoA-carboxylase] ligase
MTLGTPRLHLREVDSTNARAQRLASGGAPHGTLVTAQRQTAGHGRQGRAWYAPENGALACSLILRDPPRLLPMIAAVAVAEVAAQLDRDGREPAIKWPNDVLLGGRKLAGILAEGRPQEGWVVLGIGINVAIPQDDFPSELKDLATSLNREPATVEQALAQLLDALERWLQAGEDEVIAAYRTRDALKGREISWGQEHGTALGIADDGRLQVRTQSGEEQALDAGEVHLGTG